MQYFVTRLKQKRYKIKLSKCLIFLGIAAVFCVVIFLGFYLNSKQNKPLKEHSFYYVCAAKQKGVKSLEEMQESIKETGGAGLIYKKEKYNYIILNVYLDEESANNILEKNKEKYPRGEIFELKTNKLSSATKQQIKSNETIYKFIKVFNKNIEEIYLILMKYFSGEISENSICTKIMSIKFEIEDLSDQIESIEGNRIQTVTKNYLNLEIMYFESFLKNFLDSTKKRSILCEFLVNLTILKVEMFNNL